MSFYFLHKHSIYEICRLLDRFVPANTKDEEFIDNCKPTERITKNPKNKMPNIQSKTVILHEQTDIIL